MSEKLSEQVRAAALGSWGMGHIADRIAALEAKLEAIELFAHGLLDYAGVEQHEIAEGLVWLVRTASRDQVEKYLRGMGLDWEEQEDE